MSGSETGGTGIAGHNFTHYNYPAVPYVDNDGDFHHCGLEPDDVIADYTNAVGPF
jgi:hypothetical protein